MNKIWKRIALVLIALAAVVVLLLAVVSAKANARLGQHFETHRMDLPLPTAGDEASIARGKHLVTRYGCTVCHGNELAGGVMIDDPAVGVVLGPNLTPGKGARVARYSMADWDRIVRHGVLPDGSPAVMPSEDYFQMSDEELLDIVAYARSVPAVDATVPRPTFGPIGKVLLALGKFPLSAELPRGNATTHLATPPQTADTAEFGAHIATPCLGCHRADLAGGPMPFGPPDWPPARNLTPHASGLRDWSFEDFERAITQGIRKDGQRLRAPMTDVIPAAKAMLPTERRALWTYLRSIPAAATHE